MNTQRPEYHDNLLLVKLRSDNPSLRSAASFSALSASEHPGLSALATLERGGFIKRVTPLNVKATTATSHLRPLSPAFKASVRDDLAEGPHFGVNMVELESPADLAATRRSLANDPAVAAVERVPLRYLTGPVGPAGAGAIAAAPPPAASLWNLDKIVWKEARADQRFRDATTVKVAVLDTGVDDQHPDLKGKIKQYTYRYDGVPTPSSEKDFIGHGTHVSGTIAAAIGNGVGINGICDCEIHVWKIFGDEPTFVSWAEGFTYYVDPIMYYRALQGCIDEGINVLNLSIGGTGTSTYEAELFADVLNAGVVVVAAMGNERRFGSPTEYPAAHEGVIAVGATGRDDKFASFSNSGNHIALAAPGVAIWSTLPSYAGQYGFDAVAGPDGSPIHGSPQPRDTDYDAWNGTSMATPHVTAAVALLMANSSAPIRPNDAKKRLMNTADRVPGMNGHLHTPDYGAGRLNLFRLLWS